MAIWNPANRAFAIASAAFAPLVLFDLILGLQTIEIGALRFKNVVICINASQKNKNQSWHGGTGSQAVIEDERDRD